MAYWHRGVLYAVLVNQLSLCRIGLRGCVLHHGPCSTDVRSWETSRCLNGSLLRCFMPDQACRDAPAAFGAADVPRCGSIAGRLSMVCVSGHM